MVMGCCHCIRRPDSISCKSKSGTRAVAAGKTHVLIKIQNKISACFLILSRYHPFHPILDSYFECGLHTNTHPLTQTQNDSEISQQLNGFAHSKAKSVRVRFFLLLAHSLSLSVQYPVDVALETLRNEKKSSNNYIPNSHSVSARQLSTLSQHQY